jgi:hypothetical protein
MSIVDTVSDDAFLKSSFMERLVEHVFISEVLQEVWYTHHQAIEVMRSEVDSSGYDIVLECNNVLRHIQLKTSKEKAATASQKVQLILGEKPSGCVVWIKRHEDLQAKRMRLSFLFFGGNPRQPLPSIDELKFARHTKRDSRGNRGLRRALRVVPKRMFQKIDKTKELVERLFGSMNARR